MNKIINTRIFQFLKVVFPLILLILAVIEIMKFTGDINVDLLRHEVSQIHFAKLAIALMVTMAAITPMFFYDSTIVKLLGITVPTKKLIKQSLVINSFSNLIGFAGLIGVVLRTYFFQSYEMDKRRLLKTIANVSFFYLTGISLLSLVIVAGFRDIPLLLETKWLYLAVIGVGLYLPILVIITFIKNKKSTETSIHFRTRFQLIFTSFMEWTCYLSGYLAIGRNVKNTFSL